MQSPSSPIEEEIALTPFSDFANVHLDLRKTNEEKERLAESLANEKEIREKLEERLNIANLELRLRDREVVLYLNFKNSLKANSIQDGTNCSIRLNYNHRYS